MRGAVPLSQIQEAMLTGESVPISKNTEPVNAKAGLGDRKCLAYSATAVSAGQGLGIVIATGAAAAAVADATAASLRCAGGTGCLSHAH